jgi:hypothetical protein
VGTFFDRSGLPHGFSYANGEFSAIDFPGSIDHTSFGRGVNSGGDIVGQYDEIEEISHRFVFQGGQYQTVDTPFGRQTDILAINDLGEFVGYAYDDPSNGPRPGFSFGKDGFKRFDFPAASGTFPWTINNVGMQGGTFFDPNLSADGYVTINGFPHEIYGNVFGMNDRGQIVGSTFVVNCDNLGFCSFRTVGYVAMLPK